MTRINLNSPKIVKTALLLFSLLTGQILAQAPPPAPKPAAATNPPAATDPVAATNALFGVTNAPAATNLNLPAPPIGPAITNAPAVSTNLGDTQRRLLPPGLTNRFTRPGTNRVAFPAFPLPGPPANPAPAAAPDANVAGQVAIAPGEAAVVGASTNADGSVQSEKAEHFLKFFNAPADQIFERYSELTGRTVLRAASLQGNITIINYTPLTRTEAIQALDGALSLNNITMINQGDKFVKAVPSAEAPQHGAAISKLKDGEYPDSEQFVTHIAQLKIAKPSELAQLLATFTRNPAGIVPIDSSQMLVIRDSASNIRRMAELIEKVDVESQNDYKLEVIPIKYGKVTDLFDTMNSLISGAGGGAGGYPAGGSRSATQQRRPGTVPTTTGSGLGTSRFGGAGGYGGTGAYGGRSTSPYGQPQANQAMQQVGGAQAGTAGAPSFQQRLQQIVNRAAGTSEIQLLADARIVPDERSNSLIVFANKQDMQMITNIVSKVDVLLAQVLVEGVVLSVSLNDHYELGVSWLQNPVNLGNNSRGAGGINNGQGFLTNITSLASSLPSGFSYFANLGKNFDVSLAALATDAHTRVLQRPRLQTSHAVPGFFFTGSTVPYVTGFYDYGYGTGVSSRSTVEQVQVGVTLQVTPFITPDGLVVMDIDQDISSLENFVKIDNNDVPTTSSRHATSTLSVRDGETIMLGGYIEDNRNNKKSGVPILKDIPLFGALFRSKSRDNDRKELILLMHVTILKNPADAGTQAQTEKAKMPGIFEADKEFKKTEEQSLKKAGLPAQPQ